MRARIVIEIRYDPELFKATYSDSTDPALELGSLAVMSINSELSRQLNGETGMNRSGVCTPIELVEAINVREPFTGGIHDHHSYSHSHGPERLYQHGREH